MKLEHDAKDLGKIPGARVAILQSKWYSEHTDKMVAKCIDILREAEAGEPEIHILPGSLELPLAVQTLTRQKPNHYEAIICFGAILKGETYHFEMIVDACTRGFSQVALEEHVPIIMEVVPILNLEQLEARSRDDKFNKGIEAAMATVEMIQWRRQVMGTK